MAEDEAGRPIVPVRLIRFENMLPGWPLLIFRASHKRRAKETLFTLIYDDRVTAYDENDMTLCFIRA